MGSVNWKVEDYCAANGDRPIRSFLANLNDKALADATALIKKVKEHGNDLKKPHTKALGSGLFELRRDSIRIFFVFRPGHRIVLLDGIIKKQGRIPPDVLARMRQLQEAVT